MTPKITCTFLEAFSYVTSDLTNLNFQFCCEMMTYVIIICILFNTKYAVLAPVQLVNIYKGCYRSCDLL